MKSFFTKYFYMLILFLEIGNCENLSELDLEIISFFRSEEVGSGSIDYPDREAYEERLKWYWGQGQQARPALMHLLRNVYEGDYPNMSRTLGALSAMDGDRSDVLQYVRKRLPLVDVSQDSSEMIGYIQVSLSVLGKFGDSSDIGLIDSFRHHENYLIQSAAERQLGHVKKRVDGGEFSNGTMTTRTSPPDEPAWEKEGAIPPLRDNPHTNESSASDDHERSFGAVAFKILALCLVGALIGWAIIKSVRKKKCGGA